MSSLNKVQIIGRVGQDPKLNSTKSGKVVVNFNVATSGYGKDEATEWHRITAWDKLAENCHKFLAKGKLCYVEGRLASRPYEKDGHKYTVIEIIASNVQFLSPPDEKAKSQVPDTIPNFDDVPF